MATRLALGDRVLDDGLLLAISRLNNGYQIERNSSGHLVITPLWTDLRWRTGELLFQIRSWADANDQGPVWGPSVGYVLRDTSMLSPAVSWLHKARWDSLKQVDREPLIRVCPDVVFEVKPPSDSLQEARQKMTCYIQNGVALAVLLDFESHSVELWRQGQLGIRLIGDDPILLEPEMPAFSLAPGQIFAIASA